jgi:hypothetical protein
MKAGDTVFVAHDSAPGWRKVQTVVTAPPVAGVAPGTVMGVWVLDDDLDLVPIAVRDLLWLDDGTAIKRYQLTTGGKA